jgi:WD40 repeat protein
MKFNLDLTKTKVENITIDEPMGDVLSESFFLEHDRFYGGKDLEVWTGGISDTFNKFMTSIDTPPAGTSYGVAFANLSKICAVAHDTTPYISLYLSTWSSKAFNYVNISQPAPLPGTAYACAFSKDDRYFAVAHAASPYISVYNMTWGEGYYFYNLSPDVLPTSTGLGCAFSSDAAYLAVVTKSSPYIIIYKRNKNNFIKLPNPSDLPPGDPALDAKPRACAFSSDDTYLAVSCGNVPYLIIYKRDGDTFTKLADPRISPNSIAHGCAFSLNDDYLAITHQNTPFVTIYKREADTFYKLANPISLPTGASYSCAFSTGDTYLSIAHNNSPYITTYRRKEDSFTKIPNPIGIPTSNANGCAWTYSKYGDLSTFFAVAYGDDIYLNFYECGDTFKKLDVSGMTLPTVATACTFSNNNDYLVLGGDDILKIYKRNSLLFNNSSDPDIQPVGVVRECSFSQDDIYLATAHEESPYVTIYKRSGDTFTKLASPVSLPSGASYCCDFSKTGTYLSVGSNASTYLTIYKRSGDTFTKLADPNIMPTNKVNSCSFSKDDTYLAIGTDDSPYIIIYKRSGDTFTKLADPVGSIGNSVASCMFSGNGTYLAVASSNNGMVIVYERVGDAFYTFVDPIISGGTPYKVRMSNNGQHLLLMEGTNTYIYKKYSELFYYLLTILPEQTVDTFYDCAFSKDETFIAATRAASDKLDLVTRRGDGVQLTEGVDYTLGGIDQHLVDRSGYNVYSSATIDNAPYQTGMLYFYYKGTVDLVESVDLVDFKKSDDFYIKIKEDGNTEIKSSEDLSIQFITSSAGKTIADLVAPKELILKTAYVDPFGSASAGYIEYNTANHTLWIKEADSFWWAGITKNVFKYDVSEDVGIIALSGDAVTDYDQYLPDQSFFGINEFGNSVFYDI